MFLYQIFLIAEQCTTETCNKVLGLNLLIQQAKEIHHRNMPHFKRSKTPRRKQQASQPRITLTLYSHPP